MKGFSPKQIRALILQARKAFVAQGKKARERGQAWDEAGFDQWRRLQVAAAVGKVGLRECVNNDYSALQAHFEDLAGNTGAAFDHALRAQTEQRRQLEHALCEAMESGGFNAVYVQRICKDEYKCPPEDTTLPQLKRLVMTIKARARSKAKARVEAAETPPMRTCPACAGRGSVLDTDPYADRRDLVTCRMCGGAQVLPSKEALSHA